MSAAAPSGPVFIAADVFDGAREGYVFKAGDEGFGYYLDAQRWATAVKPHACECGKTFATEVNLGRHRDGGCPLNHPAPPFSGGVLQDDFSAGNGNALQAAVATLEGLTLGDVPNFVREPAGIEGSSVTWPGYEAELTKWLAARHQGFVKIPLRNDKFPLAASPGMRCIVRGRSPRGEHGHVVVGVVAADGNAIEFLWDPHPSKDMLAPGTAAWALFIVNYLTAPKAP